MRSGFTSSGLSRRIVAIGRRGGQRFRERGPHFFDGRVAEPSLRRSPPLSVSSPEMEVYVGRVVRIQHSRRDGFTTLDHHAVRNPDLSRAARGLLWELLSHNDGWELRHAQLVQNSSDGKHRLQVAVTELQEYGYLRIEQESGDGGRFADSVWIVTDVPGMSPHPENRDTEDVTASRFSGPGKSDPIRNNNSSNEEKKEQTSLLPDSENRNGKAKADPAEFEKLWVVARRGSKKKSRDAYRRAIADGADPARVLDARKRYVAAAGELRFVAALERWLRDERWEEEIPEPESTEPEVGSEDWADAEVERLLGGAG